MDQNQYNNWYHLQMMDEFNQNFSVGKKLTVDEYNKLSEGYEINDLDYISSPLSDIETIANGLREIITNDTSAINNVMTEGNMHKHSKDLQKNLNQVIEKYHSNPEVMKKILEEVNKRMVESIQNQSFAMRNGWENANIPEIRKDMQALLHKTFELSEQKRDNIEKGILDKGLNNANQNLNEAHIDMDEYTNTINSAEIFTKHEQDDLSNKITQKTSEMSAHQQDIDIDNTTIESNNISIEFHKERLKSVGMFNFAEKKLLKSQIKSLENENINLNSRIFDNNVLIAENKKELTDLNQKNNMKSSILNSMNELKSKVTETKDLTNQIQQNILLMDKNLKTLDLLREARKATSNEFIKLDEQNKKGVLSPDDKDRYDELFSKRVELANQEKLLVNKTRDLQKEKSKLELSCSTLKSEIKSAGKQLKADINDLDNLGKSKSMIMAGNFLRGAKKTFSISSGMVKMLDSLVGLAIAATIGVCVPLMNDKNKTLAQGILKNEWDRFSKNGKELGEKLSGAINKDEVTKGLNKQKDDIDLLGRGI